MILLSKVMAHRSARIFACLIGCTILFQLTLAAGLPWGEFAWGGTYKGVLPNHLRIASLAAIALLIAFAYIVLIRAELVKSKWQSLSRKLIWGVVAYCALGIVANAVSPSFWESVIWVPVTLLMFVTSFIVAISK